MAGNQFERGNIRPAEEQIIELKRLVAERRAEILQFQNEIGRLQALVSPPDETTAIFEPSLHESIERATAILERNRGSRNLLLVGKASPPSSNGYQIQIPADPDNFVIDETHPPLVHKAYLGILLDLTCNPDTGQVKVGTSSFEDAATTGIRLTLDALSTNDAVYPILTIEKEQGDMEYLLPFPNGERILPLHLVPPVTDRLAHLVLTHSTRSAHIYFGIQTTNERGTPNVIIHPMKKKSISQSPHQASTIWPPTF